MTEGLLGSLSSKTLNDNVKTALLDTILPSLPENTKIHVNEAMKNKLANNTTDKYLTIERESRPIYFEPRERVSEFTAGTETHRRRQII
ncbi:MAG: hypothetical protein LBI53_03555 [Candidatus Peribacteria bacterium]|jgi:hypothetical protein|nr:hypothetical protein [Candidatus Peribacteria bacterium]